VQAFEVRFDKIWLKLGPGAATFQHGEIVEACEFETGWRIASDNSAGPGLDKVACHVDAKDICTEFRRRQGRRAVTTPEIQNIESSS
jgi:hypothetical protein